MQESHLQTLPAHWRKVSGKADPHSRIKESQLSPRPCQPGNSRRNSKKDVIRRLLAEQQRPVEQPPRPAEEVFYKPLG